METTETMNNVEENMKPKPSRSTSGMRNNLKRNIVMVAVLLFVCAAVYLNWSYSRQYGEADAAMVKAEDAAMEAAAAEERFTETLAVEEKQAETASP